MFRAICILATSCCLSAALPAFAALDDTATPIVVSVKKDGERIGVDVEFTVAVSPQQAWDVLTDFDHMASFISNVQSSRITQRHGDTLQVAQKGAAAHGPLTFSFDSVREIQLEPIKRISTHMLSGGMKKLDGTTLLSSDTIGTRVIYHADSIPNTYVPPLIGTKFIENESRHQFEEIRLEMLKRRAATAK